MIGMLDYAQMMATWGFLIGTALMLSVVIAAIAYMVASFFGDEKLKAWAKTEVFQAAFSAAMVGIIIFFIATADTVITGAAQTDPAASFVCRQADQACHIAIAKNYLQIVFNAANSEAKELVFINNWFLVLSQMSLSFQQLFPPFANISSPVLAGLSMPAETISTAFDMLVKSMIALKFQEFLIDFTEQLFFPMFIVMGLVARCFSFTRKFGGLMMALGLSLYYIFPGTYVLASAILFQTYGPVCDASGSCTWTLARFVHSGEGSLPVLMPEERLADPSYYSYVNGIDPATGQPAMIDPETGLPVEAPDLCKEFTAADKTTLTENLKALGDNVIGLLTGKQLSVVKNSLDNGWLMGNGGVLDSVSRVILFTSIIPFIALIATIAGAKVMSPLLGGDVDIAGLTHLI
jgi:hypothetical protein